MYVTFKYMDEQHLSLGCYTKGERSLCLTISPVKVMCHIINFLKIISLLLDLEQRFPKFT
jgi:hypothetical protein